MGRNLLADGRLGDGLLILDDIVARGVTRAILEESYHTRCDLETVVICGRQEVVPLGLPVTYVAYDTVALVRAAVRILFDQIDGRPGAPDSYIGDYSILPPSRSGRRQGVEAPLRLAVEN